jgi:hypothetical protein
MNSDIAVDPLIVGEVKLIALNPKAFTGATKLGQSLGVTSSDLRNSVAGCASSA